jgi:hypothetical protein
MTKPEWQAHYASVPKPHDTAVCPECAKRRATRKANAGRRALHAALRDLGLRRTAYGWE